MAVLGIQNFDGWTRRVQLYQKACSEEVIQEAMAAAGDVLADALAAGTPVGSQSHKYKSGRRNPGNARSHVINVPARSKKYGVARRLIGYSKDAYYMLWVEKGHKSALGPAKTFYAMHGGGARDWQDKGFPGRPFLSRRLRRFTGGAAHSQQGLTGFRQVAGRHFMNRVFRTNIGKALEAAKTVIARAASGQSSPTKAA